MTEDQVDAVRRLIKTAFETEVPRLEHLIKDAVSNLQPTIRREIRDEVTMQLGSVNARLSSIEGTVNSNADQVQEGRRETAGIAAMLTAFFGTDGTGGTIGIAMKNAASDSRRANALAHEIFGQLDTLVNRGWLKKNIEEEHALKIEKRDTKTFNIIKWCGGLVVTGFGGSKLYSVCVEWFHRHF